MQHLGAEVGELGRLVGGDARDRLGVGGHLGVHVHEAVDLGPDLDLLGLEERADHGRGGVGAAAAQGGGDPVPGGPHEAADHGHEARAEHRLELEADAGRISRAGATRSRTPRP